MNDTEHTDNRTSLNLHLNGPQHPSIMFYAPDSVSHVTSAAQVYGTVHIDGGPTTMSVFVHDRDQAEAIAAAFTELAGKFPAPSPVPAEDAGMCRICQQPTMQNRNGITVHADYMTVAHDHNAELVPA
jgi:hypothetical protein